MLPLKSAECDNLVFHVGQPWDLIYPLLAEICYIYDIPGELRIDQLQFENIQHIHEE